jgi:hypothetical protein
VNSTKNKKINKFVNEDNSNMWTFLPTTVNKFSLSFNKLCMAACKLVREGECDPRSWKADSCWYSQKS